MDQLSILSFILFFLSGLYILGDAAVQSMYYMGLDFMLCSQRIRRGGVCLSAITSSLVGC